MSATEVSKVIMGRPRLAVDFGAILALREGQHLGWRRVAARYIEKTGEFISPQTCKRRYLEAKEKARRS